MSTGPRLDLRQSSVADFVASWQAGAWDGPVARREAVAAAVAAIIRRVRTGGQAALLDMTAEFDGVRLARLAVTPAELATQAAACPTELTTALSTAARRIQSFAADAAARLQPGLAGLSSTAPLGVTEAWLPLARVGLYVPGGLAPYPSSVLMTAVPALAAGVGEVVLCTPPRPDGSLHPAVAAAAVLAGVAQVFLLGGAQAVAAMALGAGEVPRVDKVAGPGNAYVTEAKRQLVGECGFDGFAGPSEVVSIGGTPGTERFLAWQMLAQAEHGPDSLAIGVVLPGLSIAEVLAAIQTGLASLPQAAAATAARALSTRGALVSARDAAEALQVVRTVCPEHVWIDLPCDAATRDFALRAAPFAGAVYLGQASPVAAGDYAAGPSHVLPTGGSARWASPLGPSDFMRRVSLIELAPAEAVSVRDSARAIATAEGFLAHEASLRQGSGTGTEG